MSLFSNRVVVPLSLVKFKIENELVEFWYPIVNGNINHVIAPFRSDLNKVEILFLRELISGKKDSWFRCEIVCRCRGGRTYNSTFFNRDGGQALTDALSRLKRELVRH